MKILVTFPGKYGDLLWGLPAIRALSRRLETPVDLLVAAPFVSICPLMQAQPYIGTCEAVLAWQTQDTAPISPRIPPAVGVSGDLYDSILHLGYRGWPARPLPFETLDCLNAQSEIVGSKWTRFGIVADADLHLEEPWITHLGAGDPTEIAIGFTDEYFELKVGLVTLLAAMDTSMAVLTHDTRTRWFVERPRGSYPIVVKPWVQAAATIRNADVFLGCNSALHVLAVAVGTPAVLMEPNPMRHHEIFWPLGRTGPQVTQVIGTDGQWTWDARHTRETLERILAAPKTEVE